MKLSDVLLAIIVALLWGFNFVVVEIGLTSFPPILFFGPQVRLRGLSGGADLGAEAMSSGAGSYRWGSPWVPSCSVCCSSV